MLGRWYGLQLLHMVWEGGLARACLASRVELLSCVLA